jgi:hypothetical protein
LQQWLQWLRSGVEIDVQQALEELIDKVPVYKAFYLIFFGEVFDTE